MKKIVAFGASSSSKSINQTFAKYTAGLIDNIEVHILDLNDYEMPVYSIDKEAESGIPEQAHRFKEAMVAADGIIISFAEHNGAYSAAYKNIYDWASRIDGYFIKKKPMLLLSAAPGPRGGASVLSLAKSFFSHRNKAQIVDFSLPEFHKNFSQEQGIIRDDLKESYQNAIELFRSTINI